jgi:stage III sporulation protein SpoIIIAA
MHLDAREHPVMSIGGVVYRCTRCGKFRLLLIKKQAGFWMLPTTMLREAASVLAEELRKRVVIVDMSNEIAGDGDIPHPGIGRAHCLWRRCGETHTLCQHAPPSRSRAGRWHRTSAPS